MGHFCLLLCKLKKTFYVYSSFENPADGKGIQPLDEKKKN